MPTVVTKVVDPDGTGDYTSLSSAESGEQAIRADLVSRDEQLVLSCISSGGTADSADIAVAGYTTDSTRNIVITAENDPHNGTWTTSAYRLDRSFSSAIFTCTVGYTVIRLLQCNNSHTSGGCFSLGAASGATITADRILAKTTGANKTGTGIVTQGTLTTYYLRNCLVYDFSGTGGKGFNVSATASKIYNCTAQNCATGYNAQSAALIKNCLAQNCTDGFAGTWHASSDYNCSDVSSDAPGANSQTGSATFVNAGADDFHLTSADTVAYNLGTDLSGDANNPVTIDVDGTARPQGAAFDIGFDEVVVSSERRIFVVS